MSESQKLTELVIDRTKWLRGDIGLLRSFDGSMCCLGFAAIACGYTDDDIDGLDMPSDVEGETKHAFCAFRYIDKSGFFQDTLLSVHAQEINDDRTLTDERREEKLTELFEEHGITLKFIN